MLKYDKKKTLKFLLKSCFPDKYSILSILLPAEIKTILVSKKDILK